MAKTINYQFKLLYALGMIFVLAGHVRNGGINLFYDWFPPSSFHLMLFMFASGYFYDSLYESKIIAYIWKKVKRLVIPLYLWNSFYGLIVLFTKTYGILHIGKDFNFNNLILAPINYGHQFAYNLCGWFIAPLFMVQIYNILSRKLIKSVFGGINEWLFLIFNIILGLLGVYLGIHGYNKGWYLPLDRFLLFVPFYEAGILYQKQLQDKDYLNNILYFGLIGSITLVLIYRYGGLPTINMGWIKNFKDNNLFLPFIESILGIAFWLRASRILTPAIGRSKYINIIADNTWSIMIHQFTGFMMLKTLFYFISVYTPFFHNFNVLKFKSDIWYCYIPGGRPQMAILYLIAGIIVPLIIHWGVRKIQMKLTAYKKFEWCAYL